MKNLPLKKILLTTGMLITASSAHAFFCPTNLQMINFGDSIEQVTQQCGKPNTEKKIQPNPDDATQEWVFNKSDGTAQVRMMFTKQQITSITQNGMPIASTNACGSAIGLNETMDNVKRLCPAPTLINGGNSNNPQPTNAADDSKDFSTGTVELGYNSSPAVTLVFIDGKLVAKK